MHGVYKWPINCTRTHTDPRYPSNSGAETSGYTRVLALGGRQGIVFYDRGDFSCASVFTSNVADGGAEAEAESYSSGSAAVGWEGRYFRGCRMVYSMRFHF